MLTKLRSELKKAANPKKAPQMQAYMKSTMLYHGVPSRVLKKVCRELFKEINFSNSEEWQNLVRTIWHNARFREERYAALAIAGHKAARPFQTPAAMKLYEELIISGAWWDYVDDIAIHRVGHILAEHKKEMGKMMTGWSTSPNIWKRRTSIICQIGFKDRTDLGLLYKCIEPSLSSKEFFLRKAIGWALRQVAWYQPKEIIRYVKQNRERLSPLSEREALKNIVRPSLRASRTRK